MTPLEKKKFELRMLLDFNGQMLRHLQHQKGSMAERPPPPSDMLTKSVLVLLVRDMLDREQEKLRSLIKNP
jgi:hypothetical protein